MIAIEGIASGSAAADAQAIYYALQQKLNAAWAVNQLIAVGLPLLLFFSGWGARTYELLRRRLRSWWLAAFAFFFAIAFVALVMQFAVTHLALSILAEVDGSPMPALSAFLVSKVPEAMAMSGLMGLAGILLCYILDRKHRLAWLWLAVLTTVLVSTVLMATPAFTATQPLGDTPIEHRIAAMAAQVGIAQPSIAKVDCADHGECPPGQVIGLGPTRLMILDDRLSAQTPDEQLLQVIGHEAKHYLLDNTLKPVVLIFLISAVVFLVAQTLSGAILARKAIRDATVADHAKTVPLVFAVGLATFILLQPAITSYRRHLELEADRFGLEFNRNNQALVDIMRSDAAANPMLLRYTPVTYHFRATHPDIGTRIEFAESYRPWADDEPMVYERYFDE